MDEAFTQQLIVRLTDLTKDLRFDHEPTSGEKIAPKIVDTMLEYPEDWVEGQDYPRIRLALYKGGFEFLKPSPFSVIAVGGIWTNGSIEDGTNDIKLLTRTLGKIADKRGFPPYKLKTPVSFRIGDPRDGFEGMQPHPHHFVTMQLNFIVP